MGRYDKYRILTNASKYYEPLRKERHLKAVRHYETPMLRQPSDAARRKLTAIKHVWKYGDRLYNLAHKHYGDSRLWWVIAWYNGFGTEADIYNGALLNIPLNLEETLKALGVV